MSVPLHLSHFLCVHSLKTQLQYRLFSRYFASHYGEETSLSGQYIPYNFFFKPTAFGCYVSAIGNFEGDNV